MSNMLKNTQLKGLKILFNNKIKYLENSKSISCFKLQTIHFKLHIEHIPVHQISTNHGSYLSVHVTSSGVPPAINIVGWGWDNRYTRVKQGVVYWWMFRVGYYVRSRWLVLMKYVREQTELWFQLPPLCAMQLTARWPATNIRRRQSRAERQSGGNYGTLLQSDGRASFFAWTCCYRNSIYRLLFSRGDCADNYMSPAWINQTHDLVIQWAIALGAKLKWGDTPWSELDADWLIKNDCSPGAT
jgi:hypothetical protein